jgi:hypothetical protein
MGRLAVTASLLTEGASAPPRSGSAPLRQAPGHDELPPARSASQPAALFFSPHQDDETLQMGVEIGRHVAAGHHVTVVGVGDGTASSALDMLNGKSACGFHGYTHAVVEGHELSRREMGAARTREQASALGALGATEYVPGVYPEGRLTVAVWREVLLAHESRVSAGGTVFVPTPWETTSGVGNHDHGNGGLAMQQLRAEGHYAAATVRYTVFSRYWRRPGCPGGVTRGPGSNAEKARLLAAADAYRAWSPAAGAYGIGWCHSVASDFTAGFVTPGHRYLVQRYHA